MDIKKKDGGGIIGTPLEMRSLYNRGLRSQYKISAADRIAPPQEVYESLKEQEKKRRESKLQDEATTHALKGGDLYNQTSKGRGDLTLENIMDDEDRAHMRLNTRTRRARAGAQGNREQSTLFPVQFAIAATEIPEVVPRARETSIGHAILRKSKELETAPRPRSRFSRAQSNFNDRYRLTEFVAFASLGKTDTVGLGYKSKEQDVEGNQTRVVKRGPKLAVIEEEKNERRHAETDDDLDDFANTGYRDLSSAADRIQLALLRQRRKDNERARESRKRFAHIAGLDDTGKVLFPDFEETNELLPTGEQELFMIPKSFAAKPVHDFERDQYRNRSSNLPDYLRQECDMLAKRYRQIYEQEERNIRASIAKAEEKREERLRKIREKFSLDIQSNFVAPSQSKLEANHAHEASPIVNRKECLPVNPTQGAEIGKSNRRVEEWSPLPLLRKRFGISTSQNSKLASDASDASDRKNKAWDGLSDSDDDGDFQIHAIIGADGRRIDLQRASVGLLPDEEVIITSTGPTKNLEEKSIDANPSKELFSAIFSEIPSKQEPFHASEPSGECKNGEKTQARPKCAESFKTRVTNCF